MTAAAARARRTSTGFGFLAILLWGTSIAVGRVVMGNIGLVEGPLVMSLSSGALGTVLLLGRRSERAKLRTLPLSYWAACGGLFVLYMVSYNLGVGLARDGSQLLVFGMLNYLWPVLTVVFSAMIFHRRVSAWLFPGLSLAMAGIVLAFLARPSGQGGVMLRGILEDLAASPAVYGLGLLCGVSWGLYSNLGKRIAGASEANPVPLLFLATGLVYLVLFILGAAPAGHAAQSVTRWSAVAVGALVYRVLVVDLLAYVLWDAAMRRGDQLLVAAVSFFTPLLSTACVSLLIGVRPGGLFWVSCLLLVAGAALSRASVRGE